VSYAADKPGEFYAPGKEFLDPIRIALGGEITMMRRARELLADRNSREVGLTFAKAARPGAPNIIEAMDRAHEFGTIGPRDSLTTLTAALKEYLASEQPTETDVKLQAYVADLVKNAPSLKAALDSQAEAAPEELSLE
jgi:hypothetical protein